MTTKQLKTFIVEIEKFYKMSKQTLAYFDEESQEGIIIEKRWNIAKRVKVIDEHCIMTSELNCLGFKPNIDTFTYKNGVHHFKSMKQP